MLQTYAPDGTTKPCGQDAPAPSTVVSSRAANRGRPRLSKMLDTGPNRN